MKHHYKIPDLNKPVFVLMPETLDQIKEGKCPLCSKEILDGEFSELLNIKEFQISGLCLDCQEQVFQDKQSNIDLKTCCICKETYQDYGNNACPIVNDGICCNECNFNIVIPARIKQLKDRK